MDKLIMICLIVVGIQLAIKLAIKEDNTERIGNRYDRRFIF